MSKTRMEVIKMETICERRLCYNVSRRVAWERLCPVIAKIPTGNKTGTRCDPCSYRWGVSCSCYCESVAKTRSHHNTPQTIACWRMLNIYTICALCASLAYYSQFKRCSTAYCEFLLPV